MTVLHEQILPDMARAAAWVLRFCAYYLVAAHVAAAWVPILAHGLR